MPGFTGEWRMGPLSGLCLQGWNKPWPHYGLWTPPPLSSLAPIKFRMKTFWYQLTQVHLVKWSLNWRYIYRCVQKTMSPLNILYYEVNNCTELNIVKHTRGGDVPKFCTIPPYCLTYFQFLRNITNSIFPHYYLTCWCMTFASCMMSSCVDKQNVGTRQQHFN